MHTTLLADGWHGGPGPWILLVPLFWIAVAVFVRKVVFRGRGWGRHWDADHGPGPGQARGPWAAAAGYGRQAPAPSPIDTLNRRYADGVIDELEYRERYDLLSSVTGGVTDGVTASRTAAGPESGGR
ncbi:SHOCT domain-containing protein [Streptacidiphilus sp. N1-12]|uniref:SHOCT domain-containing protein n=2 Tax=Streptacidiphilus alkalitolerans TaxID=3342712 RepID=A0ABV6W755_9ACTN